MGEDGDEVASLIETNSEPANLVFVRAKDYRAFRLIVSDRQQICHDTCSFELRQDLLERYSEGLQLLFFHPEDGRVRLC